MAHRSAIKATVKWANVIQQYSSPAVGSKMCKMTVQYTHGHIHRKECLYVCVFRLVEVFESAVEV